MVAVSTRVDDVSEHVNVFADRVYHIAKHVKIVDGCLENGVNRLRKLERISPSMRSSSVDRVDAATNDDERTRLTGQQVVRGRSSAVNRRRLRSCGY
jgi:hypothetical protein